MWKILCRSEIQFQKIAIFWQFIYTSRLWWSAVFGSGSASSDGDTKGLILSTSVTPWLVYLRPWASDRAHSRRYEAVWLTVLSTYSTVCIAWWMKISAGSSSALCSSGSGSGSTGPAGCSSMPSRRSPLLAA